MPITATTKLAHEDRIVLSPTHLYVYMASVEQRGKGPGLRIDYETMQREIAGARVGISLSLYASNGMMLQGIGTLMNDSWTPQDPAIRLLREDLISLMPMVRSVFCMG